VLGDDGTVADLITVGADERQGGAPPGHPADREVLGVPLTVRGTVYGNLCVSGKRDGTPFTDDDEKLLTALASAASVSIENARLYERLKYTTEQFQRRMLPDLPDLGRIEVRARYQPASELPKLGGDWYDVLVLPDGVPCIIVGDVTGHDPGVAPVMGQFRNMLRALAHDRGGPPGVIVSKLDEVIGTLDDPPAATLVLGRLEERSAGEYTFHWTNAGHPPPLLITQDGSVRYLAPPRHGIPVGVDTRLPRPDHEHPLPPGSTLLLFTDGLVERRDRDIDEGLRALAEHAGPLATATLDVLCDAVIANHGQVFDDDVAVLVVRVPPRPGG
jgi:serine phosphatase RsbU (regulator of sigma subunit)